MAFYSAIGIISCTIRAVAALLLRTRYDELCLYLDCPALQSGTETGIFERALAQWILLHWAKAVEEKRKQITPP